MTAGSTVRRRDFLKTAVVLGVAGSGCTRSASEEISFWALGREGERVTKLLEEFERRNPRYRIKLERHPWTAAHQKLLTAFAGNSLPDVFQLGNTWIPEFDAIGALSPLDALLANSTDVDVGDYFPGIWDTNVIGGQVYGIPWYVDTRLMFYRKDLLEQAGYRQPPTTWSQWAEMMIAVKRIVRQDQYSVLFPLNEFEPVVVLGLQQSDLMLRDGDRYGNFRSPGFQRALTFYCDAFARGWAPFFTNTQINPWEEFARSTFTFYVSGPWNIVEFQNRMPPNLRSAWMTASMPGPTGPGESVAGGSSLVISRHARNREGAWKLIEFFSAPDIQSQFHTATGNMPPRRSSWSQARIADDVYAKAFREQLERVKAAPKVPEWERIADEIRLAAERVIRGGDSISMACTELDQRVDAILEKRRWVLDQGAHA